MIEKRVSCCILSAPEILLFTFSYILSIHYSGCWVTRTPFRIIHKENGELISLAVIQIGLRDVLSFELSTAALTIFRYDEDLCIVNTDVRDERNIGKAWIDVRTMIPYLEGKLVQSCSGIHICPSKIYPWVEKWKMSARSYQWTEIRNEKWWKR